jgi:glycerophosphoryl diester phosphodiesterase
MMGWVRQALFFAALAFLGLTFVNASWIVGARPGHVRLIANGGIAQDYAPGARAAPCPAQAILPPLHAIFEDTLRAVFTARRMGADLVAIDLVRTADGALVLYPDADLGCRTDARGPLAAHTLAQVRGLDIGYGYSADHSANKGASFPLRGKGRGLIITLDDLLDALPGAALVYRFPGNDPAALDLAVKVLRAHRHDPVALGEGVIASAPLTDAAARAFPGIWTLATERAAACLTSYRFMGWSGFVPPACQRASVAVPLDSTLTLWGWPARFETRIEGPGTMVLVQRDTLGTGLRHSRELADVPASFRGYVLVDNFWTVGPALRPSLDARTNAEAVAAQKRDDDESL